MWPTLATWVGNIIAVIETVMGYFSGETTNEMIAGLYQALYEMDHKLQDIHDYICPDYGTTPYVWSSAANASSYALVARNNTDTLLTDVGTVESLVTSLHNKVGNPTETDTLASLLYYLATRVGGGEDPPPLATSYDTARILAGLYYIAQSVVVPAWSVDNQEVLDAITAAKEHLAGTSDRDNTEVYNAITDPNTGAIRAINDNTSAVEASINGNVDAAESAILGAIAGVQADTDDIQQTLAEGLTAEGGGNFYPGAAGVTFSDPVDVSGPDTITGPMDGLVVEVLAIPNGQSAQSADAVTRHKGLAFVAFINDRGEAEELQPLQFSKSLLKPNTCLRASQAAVYCKAGGTLRIRSYLIN